MILTAELVVNLISELMLMIAQHKAAFTFNLYLMALRALAFILATIIGHGSVFVVQVQQPVVCLNHLWLVIHIEQDSQRTPLGLYLISKRVVNLLCLLQLKGLIWVIIRGLLLPRAVWPLDRALLLVDMVKGGILELVNLSFGLHWAGDLADTLVLWDLLYFALDDDLLLGRVLGYDFVFGLPWRLLGLPCAERGLTRCRLPLFQALCLVVI